MNAHPSAVSGRIRRSFRNVLRHFVVLAAGLMMVSVPSFAFADDDPFDRPGPYVGLSGMYQTNVFEGRVEDLLQDEAGPVPISVSIEDSGGLGALVGYRVASFFAAELQYEWVDEYDIKAGVGPLSKASIYSITGHTLTGNTKFIIPFWRIQPYLVVGVGFSTWDVDRGPRAAAIELLDPDIDIKNGKQTDLAARAGLGLDLYVTENIVINAQGQAVLSTLKKPDLGDIDDLNYVGFSAGLQYRF